MPKICAFPHCHVSHTPQYEGHRLFQIPTRVSQYYDGVGWAKKLANIAKKYRDEDRERIVGGLTFEERLAKGQVCICYKHFAEEDIEVIRSKLISLISFLLTLNPEICY